MKYLTENKREYTNREFALFEKGCYPSIDYYDEKFTYANDYDGNHLDFPRVSKADKRFFHNAIKIIANDSSKERQKRINEILNRYVIIDLEPVLSKDGDLFGNENCRYGYFHVSDELSDVIRDAVNNMANKYSNLSNEEKNFVDIFEK